MLGLFKRNIKKEEKVSVETYVVNGYEDNLGETKFKEATILNPDLNKDEKIYTLTTSKSSYTIPENQLKIAMEPYNKESSIIQDKIDRNGFLRLKKQYIFNVFERVDEEDPNFQAERQVENSIMESRQTSSRLNSINQFQLLPFIKILLATFLLYFSYNFIVAFHWDVLLRVEKQILKGKLTQAKCDINYEVNQCHNPVSFMVSQCLEWKNCILHDYDKVERSPIIIQLISQLINEFMVHFHTKEMIFSLLILSLIGTVVVAALHAYLARARS